MTIRSKHALVSAAISMLALAGAPTITHAAPVTDVQSRVVRFDDLNLSTSAGIQALYSRIRSAAQEVCGPETVSGTRLASSAWRDCVSTAVYQAVRSVHSPSLSAYFYDRLRATAFKRTG